MVNTASAPVHTGVFELTANADANGKALTVTVAVPDNAMLQSPLVASVKFKVTPGLALLTVTVAVPPASMVTVPLEVPS